MRRFLGTLALLAAVGCGEGSKGENVPLEDVPKPVMKTAKEELPDVTFEQAWKTHDGNYEVRGRMKNGKLRDVQVTPAGKTVELD